MEKRNITISLLVPVYNGMDYWKECVISINEYGYLFDNIIVSINKGESYQEDIETAKTINNIIPPIINNFFFINIPPN